MKQRLVFLVTLSLFLILTPLSFASPYAINLSIPSLTLKNRKAFGAVSVKSFDYDNGRVVLIVGRSISTVQIELLPDDLAAQIMQLIPPEAKAQARSDRQAAQHDTVASQKATDAAGKKQDAKKAQEDEEARQRAEQANEAKLKEKMIYSCKRLARERAYQFYHYEYNPGSGSSFVFDDSVMLEEPEEVSGWQNRYRVQGKIGVQFYDSKGSSFGTRSRQFEVVTEGDKNGTMKVVDFTDRG